MPIDVTFPTTKKGAYGYVYNTTSPRLNRMCFELDNLLAQLKVQFSFGLTDNILRTHFAAQVNKQQDLKFKILKATNGFDFVLIDDAFEVTLEARNVPSGLTGGKKCVACGLEKTGQPIVSHGAVPASAWSEIVCSALEELGVNIATLTPQEKQLVKELVNIGEKAKANAAFPAADAQQVSMCKSCENLHGNMSVIQRHKLSITKPVHERPINLVGPQFGATVAQPEGDLFKLEQITRNTARRVITAMEAALQEEMPPKFIDPTFKAGKLRFDKPEFRYTSDQAGQYPVRVKGSRTQTRETRLVELLEHILMNIDLFTHRLNYQAFRVCSLPKPVTRRNLG